MTGSNDDRRRYCDAWASMMVDIWLERAKSFDIHVGDLMDSFMYDVSSSANGEVDKIVHAYNYYGRMVDMGVGKGVKYEERQNSKRKQKTWYADTYYRSVKVLTEKMAQLYGESFLSLINENMR